MSVFSLSQEKELEKLVSKKLKASPVVRTGWVVTAPNPEMELDERFLLVHIEHEGNVVVPNKDYAARLEPGDKVAVAYNGRSWIALNKVHAGSELAVQENFGNEFFFIDEMGHASFESMNAGTASVGGLSLQEHLDTAPRGIVAIGTIGSDVTISTTGETAALEVGATLVHGRMYRVYTSGIQVTVDAASGALTTTPARLRLALRENGASSPTTSSHLITWSSLGNITTNAARIHTMSISTVFFCDDGATEDEQYLNSGLTRFLLSCNVLTIGAGTAARFDTNAGAESAIQLVIEDIGPLVPDTGVAQSGSGGGTTEEIEYTKTYSLLAVRTFRGDGSLQSTVIPRQGNNPNNSNGNLMSFLEFNETTIQSDTSGATILTCEVYLYYDFWFNASGGTAIIGTHSLSTLTGVDTRPGSGFTENRKRVTDWQINQGKWVSLGTTIGNEFKAGTSTGIIIGRGRDGSGALSNNDLFYGRVSDGSSSNPPKLRIKYKK